jgi:hypothetical protein
LVPLKPRVNEKLLQKALKSVLQEKAPDMIHVRRFAAGER